MGQFLKTIHRIGALALFAAVASAGEPPVPPPEKPEKPVRPFPEFPDVLGYESFEVRPVLFTRGEVVPSPSPDGTQCFKLGERRSGNLNERVLMSDAYLGGTIVKFPAGLDPERITLHMDIWTDSAGEITIKVKHANGEYGEKRKITTLKKWFPLTIKLTELNTRNLKGPNQPVPTLTAKAEHTMDVIELIFRGPEVEAWPKLYIDDFLVTFGTDPDERVGVLKQRAGYLKSLERTPQRDGYSYSLQSNTLLGEAIKTAHNKRKSRSVLVVGPTEAATRSLARTMNDAAKQKFASGLQFTAAADADGYTLAGLDDMRQLLPSRLQKEDAGTVLLVFGAGDATVVGSPSDAVLPILDRALKSGTVPFVVLPVSKGADAKAMKALGDFSSAVRLLCNTLGVPCLEGEFAVKDEAAPTDGKELTAAAQKKIAELGVTALGFVQGHLNRK